MWRYKTNRHGILLLAVVRRLIKLTGSNDITKLDLTSHKVRANFGYNYLEKIWQSTLQNQT